jgi:CHAT domain-containing protein
VRRVFVCPDAAAAAVPLAVLVGAEGRPLLGGVVPIHHLAAAQDLVPREGDAPGPEGSLLVGGVDYGEGGAGGFPPLPSSLAEVEEIAPRLPAPQEVLQGSEATEARVREAVRGKALVHLATHGFVRLDPTQGLTRLAADRWLGGDLDRSLAAGHDPRSLAGLAFAGANPRHGGGDDDGILTAGEASYLDLDGCGLVVLSACETARGTAPSGEGVIGLVQAFQMAGAKQVLGSLWKVDDAATQALMAEFYAARAANPGGPTAGAAESLRLAQARVRERPAWRHPYYWAAWVAWGLP